MIAPREKRGMGYGRAALVAFLRFVVAHLDEIRSEFAASSSCSSTVRELPFHFVVKIGEDNGSSIKLFESLGFVKEQEEANFFGEFKLLLPKESSGDLDGWVSGLVEKFGVKYEEVEYVKGNEP